MLGGKARLASHGAASFMGSHDHVCALVPGAQPAFSGQEALPLNFLPFLRHPCSFCVRTRVRFTKSCSSITLRICWSLSERCHAANASC